MIQNDSFLQCEPLCLNWVSSYSNSKIQIAISITHKQNAKLIKQLSFETELMMLNVWTRLYRFIFEWLCYWSSTFKKHLCPETHRNRRKLCGNRSQYSCGIQFNYLTRSRIVLSQSRTKPWEFSCYFYFSLF